jgi:hypothetical protein
VERIREIETKYKDTLEGGQRVWKLEDAGLRRIYESSELEYPSSLTSPDVWNETAGGV